MKNKYKVLLLILILLAAGGFAISASGIKIQYFENYGTNFRRNVKILAEMANLKLPERVDAFLSKTPEPLTTEEKLAIIDKMEQEQNDAAATPTPDIGAKEEKIVKASSKIVALKNAYAYSYAPYKGGLLCALDGALVMYGENGEEKWKGEIQSSSSVLKTAGDYIMIAEKNGSKIYLFRGEKKIWEISSENAIISADVSKNGDVVVISDKQNYKGTVTVYNKKGSVVYQWNSGKYEILDADISSSTRTLAVSLLNTDSGADSKILMFDMRKEDSSASVDLADSIVFDIEFCGETLNAIADNKIAGVSTDGEILWTSEFEQKTLNRYAVESVGYKLCVFDNSNVSEIHIISSRGAEKYSFESRAFPDKAVISDGYILYNDGRQLIFSGLSGKNQKKYNCTRDIYDIYILGSKSMAAIYNSGIEFINI